MKTRISAAFLCIVGLISVGWVGLRAEHKDLAPSLCSVILTSVGSRVETIYSCDGQPEQRLAQITKNFSISPQEISGQLRRFRDAGYFEYNCETLNEGQPKVNCVLWR